MNEQVELLIAIRDILTRIERTMEKMEDLQRDVIARSEQMGGGSSSQRRR